MNKKIIAIFASMMIALCFVGVSYALWYKYLTINGRIGTDNVDMVFTRVLNPDPQSIPPAIHLDPKGLDADGNVIFWDKDVGWTEVTRSADRETLNITLHNVYPCYFNDLEIHYNNTGSVPVKIQGYALTAIDFTPASRLYAGDGEIYIEWVDGRGSQIDPHEEGASSLIIHVEQPALQGHTYHFNVTILFVQWNEYNPEIHGPVLVAP
jgi:hypothetical protein